MKILLQGLYTLDTLHCYFVQDSKIKLHVTSIRQHFFELYTHHDEYSLETATEVKVSSLHDDQLIQLNK